MGCFVLFLHQTSTHVCSIPLEDSPAPAARDRVTHNILDLVVNRIHTTPSLHSITIDHGWFIVFLLATGRGFLLSKLYQINSLG
jgi:hypothetical protein